MVAPLSFIMTGELNMPGQLDTTQSTNLLNKPPNEAYQLPTVNFHGRWFGGAGTSQYPFPIDEVSAP